MRLTHPSLYRPDFVTQALSGVFGELSGASLDAIRPHLEWRRLAPREVLFEAGDPADGMYILVSGRLEVYRRGHAGGESIVGEVTAGESVGEMALLTGDRRSVSVRALRDSVLARVSPESFHTLSAGDSTILANVARTVLQRHHQSYEARPRRLGYRTVALVPLTPGLDPAAMAGALALELGAFGTVRRFDATMMTDADGSPGSLTERLSTLEQAFDLVLLEGRLDQPGITARFIRQADKVLLVADTTAAAAIGEFEHRVLDGLDPAALDQTLVLVHPPDTVRPARTSDWLRGRAVRGHVHLRSGHQDDIARLARLLTGQAVALVLGGGGARGFAHVGVIRALQELAVPIDIVCGTSTGALVGAGAALELEAAEIYQRGAAINAGRPFADFTLPLLSVLKGRRLERLIRQAVGEGDVEDLWKTYLCLSSSLTRSDAHVHRRGTLWKAVRASMGLPGILPPFLLDGELLIDGGVVNNLPVDVVQNEFGCRTIGVSVSVQKQGHLRETVFPSPWQHLYRKYVSGNGGGRIPTLFDVIIQTTTLASYRKLLQDTATLEVYLHPPVENYGMMDIRRYDEIVAVGYRHAMDNAESLQRLRAPSLA